MSKAETPLASAELGVAPGESHFTREKGKLTDEEIIGFYTDVKAMADTERRPRELIWQNAWDLYNGTYDWTGKAWWQSQINVPKVRPAIDRAVGIFRRSLLRLRQFYGIEAESKAGVAKGRYTQLLLDYWFGQCGAFEELMVGMKVGLITSTMVMKLWWQYVREQVPEVVTHEVETPVTEFGVQTDTIRTEHKDITFKTGYTPKLAVKCVNPFNFWVVPKTNGRSCIERTTCTVDELFSLAEEGIYRMDTVKEIAEAASSETLTDAEEAIRRKEGLVGSSGYIKEVERFHYWGDIYDKDGRIAQKDARFTVCGGKVLAPPSPNPFYHKLPPYIIGSPYIVPFSTYNRGMIEDVAEIAKAMTELVCAMIDGAKYDAAKSFSVDLDLLDDQADAKEGQYPGKVWLMRSSAAATPGQQAIRTVDVGHVPQEAIAGYGLLDNLFQQGSYVNEYVAGYPSSTEKTLGEVNLKTTQSLEGLDEGARNIEITVLEPALDLAMRLVYQYNENYMIDRLMENYPQISITLQGLTPPERYAIMATGYSFKVRGLSVMVDKQQRLGEVMQFVTMLAQVPGLIDGLDRNGLLEELMMPMSWNPEKLIIQGGSGGASIVTPSGAQPAGARSPIIAQMEGANGGAGTGTPGMTPMQQFSAREGARASQGTNPQAISPILRQLIAARMGGQ